MTQVTDDILWKTIRNEIHEMITQQYLAPSHIMMDEITVSKLVTSEEFTDRILSIAQQTGEMPLSIPFLEALIGYPIFIVQQRSPKFIIKAVYMNTPKEQTDGANLKTINKR